ncbi:MAG: hypothetical protein RIQ93_2540 [Verrucomicrobiota bacterium]
MIASVAFRNFKALRATSLTLSPFNLVIGPNGSGKSSLIEALLMLRTFSKLPPGESHIASLQSGPEIEFHFLPPHEAIAARLRCVSEVMCDFMEIVPSHAAGWAELRTELMGLRSYVLDHNAMGVASARAEGEELNGDGGDIAAVFARIKERDPEAFASLTAEMLRISPEFRSLELVSRPDDHVELALELEEGGLLPANELSQGMLYLLALLALAFEPSPPRLICIEEVDRGIHPRMLREVRDLLYRLSYPKSFGLDRPPTQIIATTHSPYLLDLFREHPEEVVISHKHGRAAHFERLVDRKDLPELLREGSLGDMWFSGILGGVPEEK